MCGVALGLEYERNIVMSNRRGFKVKRSGKRLYKKKKSKAAQIAAIIITIIAAAGLLVVGYSLGKPLLEYFSGKDNRDSSVSYWTPTIDATTDETEQTTTTPPVTTTPITTTPANKALKGAVKVLSGEDISTSEKAKAAILKAKQEGYSAIICSLKDETGFIWYNTSNEKIKDSDIVKGSLSAQELANMIKSQGMTPVAKISTLKDKSAQPYIDGSTYKFADGSSNWIDNRIENGGKPWLSPFNKPSVDYISSLVGEITKAGFNGVVLINTEYPDFKPYDISVLANVDSSEKRAEALNNVIKACQTAAEANGSSLTLEISASELVQNTDFSSTTAEVLNIKTISENIGFIIRYSDDETAEITAIKLAEGFEMRYKQIMSEAMKKLKGREISPYYSSSAYTTEQLDIVKKITDDLKLKDYIVD